MSWEDFERMLCWMALLAYVPASKLGYTVAEWRIRQPMLDAFESRWPLK